MRKLSLFPIFLAAFLLFTIQLILGKTMLPYFGGSPAVWNTNMMFFQIVLLLGYIYAHGLCRHLTLIQQSLTHITLLIVAAFILLLRPWPDIAQFADDLSSPVLIQISWLALTIGFPFLLLSATSSLIQKWYGLGTADQQRNVYILYKISNIGSIMALLGYPLALEYAAPLKDQLIIWQYGFAVLTISFVVYGFALFYTRWQKSSSELATSFVTSTEKSEHLPLKKALFYALLAFFPSALTLAITTKITTDIGNVPLLWALPLGLYLLSFILAFQESARETKPHHHLWFATLGVTVVFALFDLQPIARQSLGTMTIALTLFYLVSYLCHRELYLRRPTTKFLTSYYLYISLGGALGGIFINLIAPLIFPLAIEFPVLLAVALVVLFVFCADIYWPPKLIPAWLDLNRRLQFLSFGTVLLTLIFMNEDLFIYWAALVIISGYTVVQCQQHLWLLLIVAIGLVCVFPYALINSQSHDLATIRNYFGILRVIERDNSRMLMHGTTQHGVQSLIPGTEKVPLSYYNATGPAGDVFRTAHSFGNSAQITALGLGTGSIACLARSKDDLQFIEIDPDMVKISGPGGYFSFIEQCHPQARFVIGDGRLKMKDIPATTQDLIFVDAFSSDSIPLHLITTEAVSLYLQKIKPNGMIAMHISNRYYDLLPEIAAIAKALDLHIITRTQMSGTLPGTSLDYAESTYVVLANSNAVIQILQKENGDWQLPTGPMPKYAWTDQTIAPLRALHILQPK